MHLLVILMVTMSVFGPQKLPELGKGLGEGIRGFKQEGKFGGPKTHQSYSEQLGQAHPITPGTSVTGELLAIPTGNKESTKVPYL
jgi:sec-independent protein translocase protein TatA